MTRKAFKDKRHSCKMCKPHKMHWSNRWSSREEAALRRAEREIQDASRVLRNVPDNAPEADSPTS